MITIQELAAQVRKQFEQATRTNGETHFVRKDEFRANDWVYEMCVAAHGEMFPDDWRYAFIVEALDAIADSSDQDAEDAYLEADIYNHQLIAWLGSHGHRPAYVDEAVSGLSTDQREDIISDIQKGQAAEKNEVLDTVRRELQKRLEELEEEAE